MTLDWILSALALAFVIQAGAGLLLALTYRSRRRTALAVAILGTVGLVGVVLVAVVT